MNWIDLTLLLVLVLFGVRGYFKGLFREVFSLIGLVFGFMAAVRYNEPMAALVRTYWNISPFMAKGAAFMAAFFIVYFLLSLVGWLLHRSEKMLFLRTVNRLGGAAIGVGKGAAVMALLVLLLVSTSWVPRLSRDHLEGGYLVVPLYRLGESLVRLGREKLFPRNHQEAQFMSAPSWPG